MDLQSHRFQTALMKVGLTERWSPHVRHVDDLSKGAHAAVSLIYILESEERTL